MKERPILFSGAMVRALLDGTKTQTRRMVKMKPHHQIEQRDDGRNWPWMYDGERDADSWLACPYGQPGDRLWVREAHWMDRRDTTLAVMNVDGFVVARNGQETGQESNPEELALNHFWRLLPSIHMPRWASRITLEVTAVRVERLQDISEADARAEGITDGGCLNCGNSEADCGCLNPQPDARDSFIHLWQSINGPDSWTANPWVWVVEFKRLEKA